MFPTPYWLLPTSCFSVKPPPAHFLSKPLKALAKIIRQVCRLFPPSGAYSFHDQNPPDQSRPSGAAAGCRFGAPGIGGRNELNKKWTYFGSKMALNPFIINKNNLKIDIILLHFFAIFVDFCAQNDPFFDPKPPSDRPVLLPDFANQIWRYAEVWPR
jgi:hypothetical protein